MAKNPVGFWEGWSQYSFAHWLSTVTLLVTIIRPTNIFGTIDLGLINVTFVMTKLTHVTSGIDLEFSAHANTQCRLQMELQCVLVFRLVQGVGIASRQNIGLVYARLPCRLDLSLLIKHKMMTWLTLLVGFAQIGILGWFTFFF